MTSLSEQQYNDVLRVALKRLGLDDRQIATLLAARWPTCSAGLIAEGAGRGILVTLDDVTTWLRLRVGAQWPDGQPVDASTAVFSPLVAEAFFAWAIESGRARRTLLAELRAADPTPIKILVDAAHAPEN